jgi:hypothetical protein
MARGYPDYANPVYSIASKNLDFSVLNALLGGVATLDGRGRFYWWDNFREGISAWHTAKQNDGVAPVASTAWSEVPPASALLTCGTAAGAFSSIMTAQIVQPRNSPLGLEFSIYLSQGKFRLDAYLLFNHPTDAYTAGFRFDFANNLIYIYLPTGFTLLPGTPDIHTGGATIPIKFTADRDNYKYGRLLIGENEIDTSGYTLGALPPVANIYTSMQFNFNGSASDGTKLYIGHVYLTLDEP